MPSLADPYQSLYTLCHDMFAMLGPAVCYVISSVCHTTVVLLFVMLGPAVCQSLIFGLLEPPVCHALYFYVDKMPMLFVKVCQPVMTCGLSNCFQVSF